MPEPHYVDGPPPYRLKPVWRDHRQLASGSFVAPHLPALRRPGFRAERVCGALRRHDQRC